MWIASYTNRCWTLNAEWQWSAQRDNAVGLRAKLCTTHQYDNEKEWGKWKDVECQIINRYSVICSWVCVSESVCVCVCGGIAVNSTVHAIKFLFFNDFMLVNRFPWNTYTKPTRITTTKSTNKKSYVSSSYQMIILQIYQRYDCMMRHDIMKNVRME